MSDDLSVVHAADRSRFEVTSGGATAVLTYELEDEGGARRVALTHTVVPVELEGRGVGGRLAATAVAWAREEGREVLPLCSFVRGWLERHPQ